MFETTQQVQRLQVNTRSTRFRQPFTMVPDAVDDHDLSPGEERSLRKMIGLIRRLGGRCDWPIRRIAAAFGISKPTCKRHLRRLAQCGLIEVKHRPNARGCRQLNDTNIYTLPGGGGGVKNEPQVLNPQRENTKTTAPESYARLRWEHNRFQNHPPAMREQYEKRGLEMAKQRCQRRQIEDIRIAAYNEQFKQRVETEEEKRESREFNEWLMTSGARWDATRADWQAWRTRP